MQRAARKVKRHSLSSERTTGHGARTRIWSLAEFLERPLDPLQDIVDSLSGVETNLLAKLPGSSQPRVGLPNSFSRLRNAGMNPHLAGEHETACLPSLIRASIVNEAKLI